MNGTARRRDRLLAKHLFLALNSQLKSKSSHLNSSSTTGPGLAVLWSARGCAAEQKEQVLATTRCAPARVAFQTGAVAHQREVAAFAAGLTLVALGFSLGAFLRRNRSCAHACIRHTARVSPWQGERLLLELLGGREFLFGLGLERRAAGDFAARFAAAEGRDVAAGSATRATLPPADGGG